MTDKKISLKAIKIGLLGDSTVGKTAICNSLLGLEFNQDMLSTIGSDKLETKFNLKNGNEIKLILWDTAGQERFRSVALKAIKAVQGIVLVFDVTKKSSFDNIGSWIEDIKENLQNPCLILFGNKIDLGKEKWQVSTEEAKAYAEKMKLPYYETSAKTKQGIQEGFSYIVNETYEKVEGKIDDNIDLGKKTTKEKSGCFGKKKNKNKNEDNKKKGKEK